VGVALGLAKTTFDPAVALEAVSGVPNVVLFADFAVPSTVLVADALVPKTVLVAVTEVLVFTTLILSVLAIPLIDVVTNCSTVGVYPVTKFP
jgi:hypothetical protein